MNWGHTERDSIDTTLEVAILIVLLTVWRQARRALRRLAQHARRQRKATEVK